MATSCQTAMTPASASVKSMTAPVLDYNCLFTHDLKRKQKRWQDGRLKYHTFNKRVMVYDDRGHFIGDAHWQSDGHLDEGDELELDRGGAIVQVSDCTGQREQDLTELLDKRAREVEKRRAIASAKNPRASTSSTTPMRQEQAAPVQSRHRPLSTIIGTPSRIGRAAIPQHSPYTMRQMAQGQVAPESEGLPQPQPQLERSEDSRPSKRARREQSPLSKSSHARSLFGATLTLSSVPVSTPFARCRPLQERTNVGLEVPDNGSKPTPQASEAAQQENLVESPSTRSSVRSAQTHVTPHPVSTRLSCDQPKPHHATASLASKTTSTTSRLLNERKRGKQGEQGKQAKRLEESQLSSPSGSTGDAPIFVESSSDDLQPAETVRRRRERYKAASAPDPARLVTTKHNRSPGPEGADAGGRVNQARAARQAGQYPPLESNEPRTELRIKPQKRRGLLLVSEQLNRKQPLESKVLAPQSADLDPKLHSSATHHLAEQPQQAEALGEKRDSHNATPSFEATNSKENLDKITIVVDAKPVARVANKRETQPTIPPLVSAADDLSSPPVHNGILLQHSSSSDGATEPCVMPSRRSKRAATQMRSKRVLSDDEAESSASEAEPSAAPHRRTSSRQVEKGSSSGPRVTRLARKSVKSREIIGLVMPDTELVFAPHRSIPMSVIGGGRGKSPSATEAISPLDTKARQTAAAQPCKMAKAALTRANTDPDDQFEAKAQPRLSNPATRGKKAARREDAAGQLPQTMVQLDPVAPRAIGAPRPQPQPQPQLRPQPQLLKPQKDHNSFPGFARANGGPWSRHAEDLLGMTRPAHTQARRP